MKIFSKFLTGKMQIPYFGQNKTKIQTIYEYQPRNVLSVLSFRNLLTLREEMECKKKEKNAEQKNASTLNIKRQYTLS